MRMLIPAVLALTAASIASAGPADDVRCREIGFSLAAEAQDAAAFESYLDDDARFVGDSVLRGPQAIVDAWRPFLDEGGPSIKWRPRFVEVLEDGELALTRGPYRVVTESDTGAVVEHWGTFNSVWRRHDDGEWRVVFDAGSPGVEPPPEADRALLDQEVDCRD